ncbi:MAG: ELWxxDGT repeat protein [Acidobacteriota bacterium]
MIPACLAPQPTPVATAPNSAPRVPASIFGLALACILGLLFSVVAQAQPFVAQEIRDQSFRIQDAAIEAIGVTGGYFYFYADTADHGLSLWRTDGTTAGTELVSDTWPGEAVDSLPFSLGGEAYGGAVYFGAKDSVAGEELWQSDGTPAGTFLVSDSRPGASDPIMTDNTPFGTEPQNFTATPLVGAGTSFLYYSEDPVHGRELWSTDGTPGGGQLIRDAVVGPDGSRGENSAEVNGRAVWFGEYDIINRWLFVSDGTAPGTEIVVGATLGFNPDGTEFSDFAVMGNYAYFAGRDANGAEVWRTDGTIAGTGPVLDISPGPGSSDPKWLHSDGTNLYINANGEPHISDGTNAGTRMIANLNGGNASFPTHFRKAPNGNLFFFAAATGEGRELHVSDGTAVGTSMVKAIYPGPTDTDIESPTLVGNDLFFLAKDLSDGRFKPWVSDGTAGGTFELDPSSIGLSALYGVSSDIFELGGQAIFVASLAADQPEIWTSDGTVAGTQPLSEVSRNFGSDPVDSVVAGNQVFWRATDDSTNIGLRVSSGESGGAVLLAGGQGQQAGVRQPRYPSSDGSQVFFSATTVSGDGDEIYVTDGTPAGTGAYTDLPGTGVIQNVAAVNGLVYFSYDGPDRREPWVSDGTLVGTFQLANLINGGSSDPADFTQVGNSSQIVFSARGSRGREIYVTDGTSAGTGLVVDVSGDSFGSLPEQLTRSLGQVFFTADPDRNGYELYVTDGTEIGTRQLVDISIDRFTPGPDQLVDAPTLGRLFFTAENGIHGRELWATDGTVAGTQMVADLRVGVESSQPKILGEYLGLLWFLANDGTIARLYSTNGTLAGTTAVADLERLAHDGVTGTGAIFEGLLYFSAWDLAGGVELWSTDGTALGTGPVTDLNPGHHAANPKELTVAGDFLSFSASDGANREPWFLPSSDWIFGDGIETLDASRWDFEQVFGGDLLYNGAAASTGVGGLEVVVDADNDKASLADQSPNDERTYRASFFFDPNDMVFPENKRLKIFSTRMADNKRHIEAMLRWRAATGYQLRVKTHHENLIDWFGTFWHDIDPEGNELTIEWQQASAPGVADGVLKLRIDGVVVETVNGIINGDLPGTDWIQMGVVGGVTPGILGSHYFDDFRSWSSLLP